MTDSKLLQFAPFTSALDAGFWYQLSKRKLEVYMLEDKPVNICGFYSNRGSSGLPPIANIDYTSFDDDLQVPPKCFPLQGVLINTNTLEDFKVKDKKQFIQSVGNEIWNSIVQGTALEDPSVLQQLICLTYADLKKYHYYYWLAFPALAYPESITCEETKKLNDYFTEDQMSQLIKSYDALPSSQKSCFLVLLSDKEVDLYKLKDYESLSEKPGKVFLAFADPSTMEHHPGWPLRNILSMVAHHWGSKQLEWTVICFRDAMKDGKRLYGNSPVLSIKLLSSDIPSTSPNTVGWEKNRGKLIPRMVDMSASMDPPKLAESAVDLNLKLMRWRLLPELQLESIQATKCLLFGSGTLGCNVGRCLLGWGVRKITFVDNSTVSYSNPVRQSLFTFEDCLQGGKPKALAAAEAMKKIFPGVDAEGKVLNVPMPGHALSTNTIDATRSEVKQIEELISSHDIIFLLMDSRESRWLPSVIGAAKGKIVLNAALGFDTYLVMRHGMKSLSSNASGDTSIPRIVQGCDLGCYFCNDVVAPGNSTSDRTLDQQCTVTRPGVSYIAAALIVELMACILQHPSNALAPACTTGVGDASESELTCELGIVPHQIRGYLDRFQNTLLTSKAFDRCVCCSTKVLQKYATDGFDFLLEVFNDPNYLEELTGLKELLNSINMDDIYELSDDGSM